MNNLARDVDTKTLFLAEGEKHVLEALRLLLTQQAEYEVLGEARSAERLLAQVCHHSPDAILLDWHLPGFHPHRLILTLRECCPTAQLVALSVKPEHEKAAKEYGLDGFISKQIPAESFLQALSAILSDEKKRLQANEHRTNGN
jgi:two-component system, NarL family, invasion response regulator UvrY